MSVPQKFFFGIRCINAVFHDEGYFELYSIVLNISSFFSHLHTNGQTNNIKEKNRFVGLVFLESLKRAKAPRHWIR